MLPDQRRLLGGGRLYLEPETVRNPPLRNGERLPAADHRQSSRPRPTNWTDSGLMLVGPGWEWDR
jgi:hypothetical protein